MYEDKDELETVIDRYSNTLYKICYLILKNEHDTKDVLQETFLAYYTKKPAFQTEEHRKAWLIKVSQNKCREFLRFHKKHAGVPLEEMEENLMITDGMHADEIDLLSMIWNLDYKLKSVVILYYIEGYSVEETAAILKITKAAAKKRLQRAREALRTEYKGEIAYEK
ncbi:MAG: RNA polymerase sigma factor [Lachnospiraceae bacterium]|nr:RNA polymerase sigma factor [Lachnospiraceae bacterium]MBR6956696.1 RNA polymerase sigma factor [Bacillota bacterium]